jgi:glycerol uptake facilitator-like aquaporin
MKKLLAEAVGTFALVFAGIGALVIDHISAGAVTHAGVALTFGLVVILSVSTGAREKGITAGIAIGSVIALEAMFAGPICGASMNPARSLGPALLTWQLGYLWIYVAAPVCGAFAGVLVCRGVREPGCC